MPRGPSLVGRKWGRMPSPGILVFPCHTLLPEGSGLWADPHKAGGPWTELAEAWHSLLAPSPTFGTDTQSKRHSLVVTSRGHESAGGCATPTRPHQPSSSVVSQRPQLCHPVGQKWFQPCHPSNNRSWFTVGAVEPFGERCQWSLLRRPPPRDSG